MSEIRLLKPFSVRLCSPGLDRSTVELLLQMLASRPDIYQVAMRALELLHPLLCVLLTGSSLLLIQGNKAFLNIRGHPAGIAAHVDNRAFLNQLPDTVLLRLYRVLHVRLRLALKTRKCALQLAYAFVPSREDLDAVAAVLVHIEEEALGYRVLGRASMVVSRLSFSPSYGSKAPKSRGTDLRPRL